MTGLQHFASTGGGFHMCTLTRLRCPPTAVKVPYNMFALLAFAMIHLCMPRSCQAYIQSFSNDNARLLIMAAASHHHPPLILLTRCSLWVVWARWACAAWSGWAGVVWAREVEPGNKHKAGSNSEEGARHGGTG